jgi:hypothetical protein
MDTTKIRLSPEEASLVTKADWILTKNGIIEKAKQLLAALQREQQSILASVKEQLPVEITGTSPKISKGENYKGLPYLVLDYPRYFNKKDVCAIRTLFWWGNFFSTTLHLSGDCKNRYIQNINASFEFLKNNDFSICINTDEWEHHFEITNYLPLHALNAMAFQEITMQGAFIKLSKKISLTEWDEAGENLLETFDQLLKTMVH